MLGLTLRLEGLGKFIKFNDLIGNLTRDFPASKRVLEPTRLSRAAVTLSILHLISDQLLHGGVSLTR
jgi:hypothetical protein